MFRKIKNLFKKTNYKPLPSKDDECVLIVEAGEVRAKYVSHTFPKHFFNHFKDLAIKYKLANIETDVKLSKSTYDKCWFVIHNVQRLCRNVVGYDEYFIKQRVDRYKTKYTRCLNIREKNTEDLLEMMTAYYYVYVLTKELKYRKSL